MSTQEVQKLLCKAAPGHIFGSSCLKNLLDWCEAEATVQSYNLLDEQRGTMDQSSTGFRQHDEPDFSLKEWALKARISHENMSSRRFSASNSKSFREDAKPVRSSVAISSTASCPGYTVREIHPSAYPFTTALRALREKAVCRWEYSSPDGFILNSKWNGAEKYISNPLSGQVPLECLSVKTLSGRSFRSLESRITMSPPLVYPSHIKQFRHANAPITEHESKVEVTSQEKRRGTTRDVGTQRTPVDLSSTSPSPASSPPIEGRSVKRGEAECGDSTVHRGELKSDTQAEMKETKEEQQHTKRNVAGERKKQMMCKCSNKQAGGKGCLSLRVLWMTTSRNKDKHKPRTNTTAMPLNFLYHISGFSKE